MSPSQQNTACNARIEKVKVQERCLDVSYPHPYRLKCEWHTSPPTMTPKLDLVGFYREAIAAIDAIVHDSTSFEIDSALDQDDDDEEREIDPGTQASLPMPCT